MKLLTPLLNRASDGKFNLPPDGWYHLVPKGEFPHPDTKTIQVIDDESLAAMVNRFKADSAKPNFPGLLIDQEHFSYDTDKSSEAYGWIKELQNRADGIYGRVDWTDIGKPAVESGRYRFVSPVWMPDDIQKLGNKRIRPLRLDTAGMTNSPNLKGMVPLSNRSGKPPADINPNPQSKTMKSVAAKLGLSAEASEDAVLEAVVAVLNRATKAEEALNPLKQENENLKKANTDLLDAQIETDLEKYGNRFKPEKREAWKNRLKSDRKGAIELLDDMPELSKNPVLNRGSAKTPEGKASAENNDEVLANKAHAEVEQYRIANRCSYSQAQKAVRLTKPELFGLPGK